MDGREFLGRGLKFPLQVDPRTGKIAMVSEEEDIRESIGIILRTGQGERIMRPEFGSTALRYLFQPVQNTSRARLVNELSEQIHDQEPRIMDVEVDCEPMEGPDSGLVVSVSYTIRSTNSRYNHVYPFYVTEGSEGGGGA
ncbi:MAG: GPW/gp25 family protein [Oscillibacter sp.]|nr:GPW/gp25 family protein [Oscillibacter sp.]